MWTRPPGQLAQRPGSPAGSVLSVPKEAPAGKASLKPCSSTTNNQWSGFQLTVKRGTGLLSAPGADHRARHFLVAQ